MGIYVDDLIITGESVKEIIAFKGEMKTLFHMSDLGALTYYLGIEVKQGRRGIELSQAAYAKKVWEKARMGTCNGAITPMEARLELSKASIKPAVDATEYRSLIVSLRYLLNTRPELSYSVGYLSRLIFFGKGRFIDLRELHQNDTITIRHLPASTHLKCTQPKKR